MVMDELLEREIERSALHEGCVAVGGGAGRVIVIVGEAGIGKTALLYEARRLAGESGMRVLRASGATLERDFGYGVVRQLLEREVHSLVAVDRERLFSGPSAPAADVFGIALRGGGVARDTDRAFLVRHALVSLVCALAQREPLVLMVDGIEGPRQRRCAGRTLHRPRALKEAERSRAERHRGRTNMTSCSGSWSKTPRSSG